MVSSLGVVAWRLVCDVRSDCYGTVSVNVSGNDNGTRTGASVSYPPHRGPPGGEDATNGLRDAVSRYAIGVDFGTESGRAVLVDVADGPAAGHGRPTRIATASSTSACPLDDGRSCSRPTGRSRTPTTTCASSRRPSPPSLAPERRRSRRRHRRRHRLHRLHDAAGHGRRHAAVPRCPTFRREPARLGQALEAPRRPARGRPDQRGRPRDGRAVARPLRRQDLVRVVLLQGAPDPRRGARGLRRRRPPDRGRRLGGLAAHRRRDPQRLHRGLQGDVVEARRLPGPEPTSRRSTRASRRRRRRRCAATSGPPASAPAA